MTNIKACVKGNFAKDSGKGVVKQSGKVNIKIRLSHNRKVVCLSTPWDIDPKYMGPDGMIKSNYPDGSAKLNGAILALLQQYNKIIADVGPDIVYMDIHSLVNKLKVQKKHGSGFLQYMKFRISELEKEGRHGYASSYQVTVNHLESFTRKNEIEFNEITVAFLNDFKGHLRQVHKSKVNTLRIYLNNIRAVFYHAIDNGIIKGDIAPFRKFKIEQEKTAKRSLDLEDLKSLLALRPVVTNQQQRALDIFFLIFYLCGINLKDLLYLKPENLHKGRILYRRFKTGRDYSLKIHPPAQEILDRYPGKTYLLDCIETSKTRALSRSREADHDVLSQTNKLLKTIVKNHLTRPDQPAPFHVTTYTARHSWATIASKLGISRDIIAHALGHGIDTMTDIYIDFDLTEVDKANQKVINEILKKRAAGVRRRATGKMVKKKATGSRSLSGRRRATGS